MTGPKRMIAKAAAILTATMLIGTSAADAWTAYRVTGSIFAFVCADGTVYEFRGEADELGAIGPRVCRNRGGVASGSGSSATIAQADGRFASQSRRCRHHNERVNIRAGTLYRLTCELPVYPDGSQPRSHNTSRSNVRG